MRKFAALLLLLVVGCDIGATLPTLDCSSEDAYTLSLARVTRSMSEDDKQSLMQALARASARGGTESAEEGNQLTSHEMVTELHGLTGKQIIAKMNE